ncbi:sel1 repeat family protein [Planctobacterium marinum]|uniref:Sel1 repeat family protein n=1 Tax=Planctobacterium marinum TaxID=1631968 RepID=A0AA48HMH8_9ALTE|nr:hypothetical protein MACH26_34800 [Planctobacterium marinum]
MNILPRALLVVMAFAVMSACKSTGIEQQSSKTLFLQERLGIKKYNAGEYQESFELLSETATWGLKESQYFLAFMFMKGQHVQQSSVLGMAWLAVANEVKRDDWQQQYDTFYNAASAPLQTRIDAKKAEYIAKFGLKAQNMTCAEQIQTYSIKRKVRCSKGPGVTKRYFVELSE